MRESHVFMKNWFKIRDKETKLIYWKNMDTGLTQQVNPRSETCLMEASILGNIAFLDLYYRSGGNINI